MTVEERAQVEFAVYSKVVRTLARKLQKSPEERMELLELPKATRKSLGKKLAVEQKQKAAAQKSKE